MKPESALGTPELYALSPLQQGMLFHSLSSPAERLYVSELICTFRADFDPDAFARAWQRVVDRHSIFRTAFRWGDVAEPQQVTYPSLPLDIARLDWSGLGPVEQEQRLQRYCADLYRAGIDLSVPPLMRLALIRLSAGRHQFVWIYHHLLMDAWSEMILNDELFTCYEALRCGLTWDRPPATPYRAYVAWLERQDRARAESFWRAYLRGFTSPTPVPGASGPEPAEAETAATWDMSQLSLSAAEAEPLRAEARRMRLTLNTVVQAAWAQVLAVYSGEADVIFGVTVSGRPIDLPGAEHMIGPFINTIPARVRLPPEASVRSWLTELQREQAAAREYGYAPLVQIQAWAELPRGTGLFDSFIGFQNATLARVGAGRNARAARLPIESSSFRGGWTNYTLSLDVEPAEEILLTLSYKKDRVTAPAAQLLLACTKSALLLLAGDTDTTLARLQAQLASARREHAARQQRSFAEARRSQVSQLRRRGTGPGTPGHTPA